MKGLQGLQQGDGQEAAFGVLFHGADQDAAQIAGGAL